MLFITNRSLSSEKKSVSFPKFIKFNLENNAPSQEVYFCIRHSEELYEELGSEIFLKLLQKSDYHQILIYIHGFNNLPEDDIFSNTQLLQKYFDGKKQNNVLVVPIIWPCDNDFGVIKDYWDDQMSADMSGFSIQRSLNFFYSWSIFTKESSCYKRLNILAHSMGSRVLREALLYWKKYTFPQGVPRLFRNIFLLAPDIVNETLEYHNPGKIICDAGRNIIVYHANDDFALRSSKILNLKNNIASRRLGHTGPEKIKNTPSNVYAVDCDEINNQYDFPTGHTYFLPNRNNGENNIVLEHLYSLLKTGRFSFEKNQREIILKPRE